MRLDDLRKKIDILDEKMLILIQNRFQMAQEIKKQKSLLGLPIEDKNREKKMVYMLTLKGKRLKLSISFVEQLFNLIINESKRIQTK